MHSLAPCETVLPIQSSFETFLTIPSSSCETFHLIHSSSCETFLPIPSSSCVTFLPIPSLSCETFLPIPSSSCETFLPIPSSSCETFFPIPSSCETFLPIQSSCETFLPIPSSRQHFYYLSPYKLINTGILITSNVQVIHLVSIILAFLVRFCSQTSCPFVLRFPFFPLLVSCFGPRVSHWIILPYVNSRFRSVLYILFNIDFLFLDLTCTHCILLLCYTTLNCHVHVLDSLVAVSVLSFSHSYLLSFFFVLTTSIILTKL